jgi:hypothetical protein
MTFAKFDQRPFGAAFFWPLTMGTALAESKPPQFPIAGLLAS